MLKLIIGVKGTGKTKQLINLVNEAAEATNGVVVCVEKGTGLRFDVKHTVRLINTNEYLVFDAESLAGFEGATLVDKYKTMVMGTLNREHEANVREVAESLLWEHLREVVKVKRLPRYEITRIYDSYYYGYQEGFTSYTDYYESLDAFICASLGIDENADWKKYLQNMVEEEVIEKLIYHYIMQVEGITPVGEEYDKAYREVLEDDFFYAYGKRAEDYLTEADYEKALNSFGEQILAYYGEEKCIENVYYQYTTSKLIEMATIVNVSENKAG